MEEATVAAGVSTSAGVSYRQRQERRFYSTMALVALAVVFIGFAPTFYLKALGVVHFPRPAPELNPALMTHGLVFSLWTVLVVVQSQLVAAGRRDLHRSLGIGGFAFALALLPIMYWSVLDQTARGSAPPFTDTLTWSCVPLLGMMAYAPVLWLGWRARRADLQAHKRFMLGLMIMLTQPATGRLPLAPPILAGFVVQGLLTAALFIPLIVWDRRTTGRIHPATMLVGTLYLMLLALQAYFLAMPGIWSAFASQLPGMTP